MPEQPVIISRTILEELLQGIQGGKCGTPTLEMLQLCGQVHLALESEAKLYLATEWDKPEFEGGHEEPLGIFWSLELAKQISEDHLKKCYKSEIRCQEFPNYCEYTVQQKYGCVGITIVEMGLDKIKVQEDD